MDGTSVIGINLLAKKSIVYTVEFVLQELRSHVSSDDIAWSESNGEAAARFSFKAVGGFGLAAALLPTRMTPQADHLRGAISAYCLEVSLFRVTSLLLLGKRQLLFRVGEVT